MPEEIEAVVPAVEEEVEVATEVTPEDEPLEDDVGALKARLAKAEELANNQKIRAEKAEKKAKETPAADNAQAPMSLSDATALLKADVHEEDIERVEKFAKSEGISIREALKNDELKAILSVRTEKRTTANAANVSNVRRGPSKMSDDALVEQANKGKLPDDDESIDRLIAARAKQKSN